jgi:hypothetical protein
MICGWAEINLDLLQLLAQLLLHNVFVEATTPIN